MLIDGIDYTPYSDLESIEVDSSVVMTNDTMKLNIILRGELPCPSDGNEIKFTVNGSIEFGGVVSAIKETDIGTDLVYEVSALSYERWLDRHLVVGYYSQMNADQLVRNIIGQFTHGFTANSVQPSYQIPPMYINYEKVSDTIKKICDQIQWGWYVDYTKDVHFFPIEQYVSPLPNNSLYLDGNTDTKSWSDCVLTVDGTQKRNRIYLKGFKSRVSTPVTLTFVGDGSSKQWSLGYKPSISAGDVTVTVGGTPMTIKRDMADGSPGQNTSDTTSAFINYSEKLLRVNSAPASGVQVVVTMYYLADTILMREDPESQFVAAASDDDGSDGRYEYAHTDSALTSSTISAANAKGDQMLYQYKNPQLLAEFTSYVSGWRPGQSFYLRSKRRMGGAYDGQQMFIQSVTKKMVQSIPGSPAILTFDVQAASTPYLV